VCVCVCVSYLFIVQKLIFHIYRLSVDAYCRIVLVVLVVEIR
jgi:hypothetical protein